MAKTYGQAKMRQGKGASFEVIGARELELQLRQLLPDAVARKVARRAVSKAGTPVARAARRNAKRIGDHGTIARSIGKKTKGYRMSQTAVTIVGPRTNYVSTDTGHKPSKTAHLVEYGTGPHVIKSDKLMNDGDKIYHGTDWQVFGTHVEHPGAAATPFMRPAYDETRHEAKRIIAREIETGILNHMASANVGRKAKSIL